MCRHLNQALHRPKKTPTWVKELLFDNDGPDGSAPESENEESTNTIYFYGYNQQPKQAWQCLPDNIEAKEYTSNFKKQEGLEPAMAIWPDGDETLYRHPESDIVCVLPPPELVMLGSRVLTKFDLSKAQKLF